MWSCVPIHAIWCDNFVQSSCHWHFRIFLLKTCHFSSFKNDWTNSNNTDITEGIRYWPEKEYLAIMIPINQSSVLFINCQLVNIHHFRFSIHSDISQRKAVDPHTREKKCLKKGDLIIPNFVGQFSANWLMLPTLDGSTWNPVISSSSSFIRTDLS